MIYSVSRPAEVDEQPYEVIVEYGDSRYRYYEPCPSPGLSGKNFFAYRKKEKL